MHTSTETKSLIDAERLLISLLHLITIRLKLPYYNVHDTEQICAWQDPFAFTHFIIYSTWCITTFVITNTLTTKLLKWIILITHKFATMALVPYTASPVLCNHQKGSLCNHKLNDIWQLWHTWNLNIHKVSIWLYF